MSTKSKSRMAPGPKGGLIMGSLPAYKRDPVHFFIDQQREYGDVVRMKLGPYLAHLVSHPDGIRHVVQANDANYCRGRFYKKFKLFFGKGLLTTDGDEWRSHRRVAQPAFLRKVINGSTAHVVAATNEMLDRWGAYAQAGHQVALLPETMNLTLASLSRALFGLNVSDDKGAIIKAIDFGISAMFNQGTLSEMLPGWLPTARSRAIEQHRRVLTDMVERIRAQHDRSQATVDLVDLFEQAPGNGATGDWSAQAVQDELTTVFLAGQETTALALCWTLFEVARHQEVSARLREEALSAVGSDEGAVDVEKLVYTRMVIEESLRLHPPIWLFTRDALQDDVVMGFDVPAGSSVLVSPFVTHRRPDLWPDPEVFDPGRFDPSSPVRRAPFTYFPFGGGPRQCIGLHMASHELQVMVALIMSRFRLELVGADPGGVGAPVLSLRPRRDVTVKLHALAPLTLSRC